VSNSEVGMTFIHIPGYDPVSHSAHPESTTVNIAQHPGCSPWMPNSDINPLSTLLIGWSTFLNDRMARRTPNYAHIP